MRRRFESPATLARALEAAGVDDSQLRGFAADHVRIRRYIEERFSSSSQPSESEVTRYLADHPELLQQAGTPAQASDRARAELAAQRQLSLVASWKAELRRRASVVELYTGK
jgi:hypothetical protein